MVIFFGFAVLLHALDIKLGEHYVIKNNLLQKSWENHLGTASMCKPQPGFYFDSRNSIERITATNLLEVYVPISFRVNSPTIDVKLNYKDIELFSNSTRQIELTYHCTNLDWNEINLKIDTNGKIFNINWMKHCGNSRNFDFSLIFVVALASGAIFLALYFSKNKKSETESNNEALTLNKVIGFFLVSCTFVIGLFFYAEYFGLVAEILFYFLGIGAITMIFYALNLHQFWSFLVVLPIFKEIYLTTIISFFTSAVIILSYIFTLNWILNNIIGICIVYFIVRTVKILSLRIGVTLLVLSFCYNIFWVYFSESLLGINPILEINSSLNLPTMLQFPNLFGSFPPNTCSHLLFIDDLIVPGLFLGFVLRFDSAYKTSYLIFIFAIYIFSLIINVFVISISKYEQPAIIYASPLMIFGIFLNAYSKNAIRPLFQEIKLEKVPINEFQLENLLPITD